MSWVFLTDRFVYKLKKPVRLDFLDFSTLERRYLNCLEELRLNRRLARDIYLELIPLTVGDSGRLGLGGDGEPVDWLVKMRRLPRECMLDNAIARRQVDESRVRRIAWVLCKFYRQAEKVSLTTDEYVRRFEKDIQANDQALSEPEYSLSGEQAGMIGKALQSYLTREREPGSRRVASSRHMVTCDPSMSVWPTHLYSSIAWNSTVGSGKWMQRMNWLFWRWNVKTRARRLSALSETYRQCSGDDPPRLLVIFYQAYRAQMRAKLSIWHLGDRDCTDTDKWVKRTRAYLRLAEELHG
jgi:aminoglycoside phosphotransferase family enzyme